jgi:hypothetical protein
LEELYVNDNQLREISVPLLSIDHWCFGCCY